MKLLQRVRGLSRRWHLRCRLCGDPMSDFLWWEMMQALDPHLGLRLGLPASWQVPWKRRWWCRLRHVPAVVRGETLQRMAIQFWPLALAAGLADGMSYLRCGWPHGGEWRSGFSGWVLTREAPLLRRLQARQADQA